MENLDLRQLLEMLFKKKGPKPYASVLERGDMSSPHYRKYLERQQGLEGVYPELLGLTRGRMIPGEAPMAPLTIGSKVPKGYVPYTELSNIDRGLAMLKAQRRTAADKRGGWRDGAESVAAEWDTRLAPELALMGGRYTADAFDKDKERKLNRIPEYDPLFKQMQDYGDSGGTGDDRYFSGQNQKLVQPELRPGEKNYNQTKGNPPVALEEGGWLRSLFPYESGEGGPAGKWNDDGKVRSLRDLMWDKHPGLMRGYQKEATANKKPPPTSELGKLEIELEKQRVRRKYGQYL